MSNPSIVFSRPRVWVYFIASDAEEELKRFAARQTSRINEYRIKEVVPVRGDPPPYLAEGWGMVRIESLLEMAVNAGRTRNIVFRGVTQHLQYTTNAQRQELDRRSRSELAPSENTSAVLIPVGKSAQWWELAQDQRQAHFQKDAGKEGHTGIGLRYVDRVFRKLYHSRYIRPTTDYDFLTYFEFDVKYTEDFKKLLAELRDTISNPEWRYIELEYEIWMTKTR